MVFCHSPKAAVRSRLLQAGTKRKYPPGTSPVPMLFTMIDFGTNRTTAPMMLKKMIFRFPVDIATLALAGWSE